MKKLQVILALGSIAHNSVLRTLGTSKVPTSSVTRPSTYCPRDRY